MKKTMTSLLLASVLSSGLNAGMLGSAVNFAKDKAKDKVVDVAVDKGKDTYKEKRVIRKQKEEKTGTKSTLTKAEDKAIETKDLVKDTAVGSFGGQKNVDYVKRGAGYFGKALRGEQID